MIWGLVFIVGLQCGIEGAYLLQSQGAPQYAGLFSAWCDLRELAPLVFGYMMAAKVGTGIVAELGSMRISEEIDALEVMGISGITFLCATRLLASWLVLPFVYLGGVGVGLPGQLHRGRAAGRQRLVRRLLTDLLGVPEPRGPLIQLDKGDGDGHGHRARRLLLRVHGQRGAGRRRAWRPPSRWSSTSSRSTSSGCSARSCSGAPIRERRSEGEG